MVATFSPTSPTSTFATQREISAKGRSEPRRFRGTLDFCGKQHPVGDVGVAATRFAEISKSRMCWTNRITVREISYQYSEGSLSRAKEPIAMKYSPYVLTVILTLSVSSVRTARQPSTARTISMTTAAIPANGTQMLLPATERCSKLINVWNTE